VRRRDGPQRRAAHQVRPREGPQRRAPHQVRRRDGPQRRAAHQARPRERPLRRVAQKVRPRGEPLRRAAHQVRPREGPLRRAPHQMRRRDGPLRCARLQVRPRDGPLRHALFQVCRRDGPQRRARHLCAAPAPTSDGDTGLCTAPAACFVAHQAAGEQLASPHARRQRRRARLPKMHLASTAQRRRYSTPAPNSVHCRIIPVLHSILMWPRRARLPPRRTLAERFLGGPGARGACLRRHWRPRRRSISPRSGVGQKPTMTMADGHGSSMSAMLAPLASMAAPCRHPRRAAPPEASPAERRRTVTLS